MFSEAATLNDEIPFEVHHNIAILSKIASEFSDTDFMKERRRLSELVVLPHASQPPSGLPNRYIYTLSHDPFAEVLTNGEFKKQPDSNEIILDKKLADLGKIGLLWREKLLPELTCMQCNGRGRLRCPNCAGGVISEKRPEVVATNVRGDPVYGQKFYKVSCPNCNGKGGFQCGSCNGNGRLRLD